MRAYAYAAGNDEKGVFWPARMIVGFGAGGVDTNVGFIEPADARAFAALLIEAADKAEGAAQ